MEWGQRGQRQRSKKCVRTQQQTVHVGGVKAASGTLRLEGWRAQGCVAPGGSSGQLAPRAERRPVIVCARIACWQLLHQQVADSLVQADGKEGSAEQRGSKGGRFEFSSHRQKLKVGEAK